MILSYRINQEDAGKTVKQIIAREFALSSRLMSKLKKTGSIKVNGESVTVRKIVNCSDLLTVESVDTPSENVIMSDIPLDVLYEDDNILVVNKPCGMPIHPSQGHHSDTLANAVMYRYRNERITFRAITRLDGDTTGVVLVAKDAVSAQRLTVQLCEGKITKEYVAVGVGVPEQNEGIIDAPVARCEDSVIKRQVQKDGKKSVTKYNVERVSRNGCFSLIKAVPITGRTHQIRLHLSHIGVPIYGDFLYGTQVDGVRTLLHCKSLTFKHPVTAEQMCINAPLPQDIITVMDTI